MNLHSSKTVKTLKTPTSATKAKRKLKPIIRVIFRSSRVGNVISQRRGFSPLDHLPRSVGTSVFVTWVPVIGRLKERPRCGRLRASTVSAKPKVKTVADHGPTIDGNEPARAI